MPLGTLGEMEVSGARSNDGGLIFCFVTWIKTTKLMLHDCPHHRRHGQATGQAGGQATSGRPLFGFRAGTKLELRERLAGTMPERWPRTDGTRWNRFVDEAWQSGRRRRSQFLSEVSGNPQTAAREANGFRLLAWCCKS